MSKKLLSTFLFVGLLFSTNLKAENVLYCQSELATGFYREGGVWKTGSFELERFTIKFTNNFRKLHGLDDDRPFDCNVPFSIGAPEVVACVSGYGTSEGFLFNKNRLRFSFSKTAVSGFVEGAGGGSTEVLFAGTCKNF